MSDELTAKQAKTFEHGRRLSSEVFLAGVAEEKGCTCQAYVDWFTYRRWLALGFQVQKGEKGTKLTTFVPIEKTDPDTGVKKVVSTRPRTCTVFCRCQVKPIEKSE